jgi:hypothetical protein
MMDDDENVDDTQYYEEPREVIASRTGTALPSYADDARDQLQNSHRSTYSMHEAKHMKHKIPSYDLFETSKSHRGDDDDEEEDEEDDSGAMISDMYDDDKEDGHTHKRKSDSDESIERAPSSHHHRDRADKGDESLPTLADSMDAAADDDDDDESSSKHHKHKHSKKSDADDEDVPPWTAFANGDFS